MSDPSNGALQMWMTQPPKTIVAGSIWRDSDGREWVPRNDFLRLEIERDEAREELARLTRRLRGFDARVALAEADEHVGRFREALERIEGLAEDGLIRRIAHKALVGGCSDG